jgi:hypothetical protein
VSEVVQDEHEILGGEVAAGAGGERGAAEPAHRRVEPRDAEVDRGERVGEGRAARVVQVEAEIGGGVRRSGTASTTSRRGAASPCRWCRRA